MFRFASASIHYGPSSYPLNGIAELGYETITGVDDPKLADLAAAVGKRTGFPREFTFELHPEVDVLAMARANGYTGEWTLDAPQVIPERIVGMANGYTITWNKEDGK